MNHARYIAIGIIAVTAAAIFAVGAWRMTATRRPHVDVERDRFPVVGVDLSAHNGEVDFKRVAADGVDFVFLKATEGTNFKDPKFQANYQAARDAGVKVGAYHFFRFDSDGYEQGRNFLETVDSLSLDLPLAIDIEEWGNPIDRPTDEIIESIRGMIFALEGGQHKVILYTNKNGYTRFVKGRLEEMPVWVCSFTNPPMPSDKWLLWQHSHESHIDGIKGKVDLNTFNGDSLSWDKWLSEVNAQ
ncbi:MAG: hypothetical protein K2K94_10860 [Muribaculaceae bacterium]|nr:hypothetical protein [Muribaculaceae bacterium]